MAQSGRQAMGVNSLDAISRALPQLMQLFQQRGQQ
jgi:hypothetical protein